MSVALAEELAEAVAATIRKGVGAKAFAAAFELVVAYAPEFDASDGYFDTLRVTVLPSVETTTEEEDREDWSEVHRVVVSLQKKVKDKAKATVGPLVLTAEQIKNFAGLKTIPLGNLTAYRQSRTQPVVFDVESLQRDGMLVSLIEFTYYISRE